MKKKELYLEVICWSLFILFLYAGSSKLVDYKMTTFRMNNQPFDNKYTPFLVFGLPVIEFIIAALLIFRRTLLMGLWSFLSLMVVFTGYIVLIQVRFFGKIPCSCGGVISKMTWTQHLFFNLFFIILAIIGIRLQKQIGTNDFMHMEQVIGSHLAKDAPVN